MKVMQLVSNVGQIQANMKRLSEGLNCSPDLAKHFGFAHTWYVDAQDPEEPIFGFSKFVGYEGVDAATYLNQYRILNRRNTELALKAFCEELEPDSPQFEAYHAKLTEWLAKFGKNPRNPVRLMVLKSEPQHDDGAEDHSAEDRRLLELLVAIADLLPLNQKHELRSRL